MFSNTLDRHMPNIFDAALVPLPTSTAAPNDLKHVRHERPEKSNLLLKYNQ